MAGLKLRHIPNMISFMRMILLIPIMYYLLKQSYSLTLLLFVIAGVSDAVDGFLARHYHWQSGLGSIIDPAADKLLIVLSFIILTYTGHVPLWLTVIVILRDIVIVTGSAVYRIFVGYFTVTPSFISKLNTVFQIGFVTMMLIHLALWSSLPHVILQIAIVAVTVSSIWSGIDYICVWVQRGRIERGALQK